MDYKKDTEKKAKMPRRKKKNCENSSDEDFDDDLNESGFLSQATTERDYFSSSKDWFEDLHEEPLIENIRRDGILQKKEKKLTHQQIIQKQAKEKTLVEMKKKKEAIQKFNYQDFFMREINENYFYKQELKQMRADIRDERRCKIRQLFDMMHQEYQQLKQEQSHVKVIDEFEYVRDQQEKPDSFLSQFEKYYLQKKEMFQGLTTKLDQILLITSNNNERAAIPKVAVPEKPQNPRENILHNFHNNNVVKVFKFKSPTSANEQKFRSTSPAFRQNTSQLAKKEKSLNQSDCELQVETINKCLKPKIQPLQSRPSTSSQSTRPCTARSTSAGSSRRKVIDASQKSPTENRIRDLKTKNQNFLRVKDLVEPEIDSNENENKGDDEFKLQRQVLESIEQDNQKEKFNMRVIKSDCKPPLNRSCSPQNTNNQVRSQKQPVYSPRKIDFTIARDLMSRLRVNKLLENLCGLKADYVKIDVKNGTGQRNYYKLAALDQLADLKFSLLEEKLNRLIFEFIMYICRDIIPEQKAAFAESSELKMRFFFQFSDLFHRIKLFLYSLSSIQHYKDYFYAFLNRKTQLIYKILNAKFGEEILSTINNKIKQIFPKLLEEQVLFMEQIEYCYDYIDSPFTYNPFKLSFKIVEEDFFIDSIKNYYINKYEKEIGKVQNYKRYLWRKEKLEQIIERRKAKKQTDDELKIYERENESESDDELEEEIKKIEVLTQKQLHYLYMIEKQNDDELPYQKMKDLYKNVQDNPQQIIKYLTRIIENQERVFHLRNNHRMFNMLVHEIGLIHKVHRNHTLKYDVFINKYITPSHILRMANKLKIHNNPALHWIAYLYCMFALRYSNELSSSPNYFTQNLDQNPESNCDVDSRSVFRNKDEQQINQKNNEDILSYFIDFENDYDIYFDVLAEFQSIKSDILIDFIHPNLKNEYLEALNWYQFLNNSIQFQNVEEEVDLNEIYKQPIIRKPKEQVFFLQEIKQNPQLYYFNTYTKAMRFDMTQSVIDLRNKYVNSEQILLSDFIFQLSEIIHQKH